MINSNSFGISITVAAFFTGHGGLPIDVSAFVDSAQIQVYVEGTNPSAGQGYYQGVGDTLYYGDGVDLQQFVLGSDCNPTNGTTWQWGIDPPLTAPTAVVTPSASAVVNWQASTVFSTMGLIVDSQGNIQQLISVNASPVINPNSTQFGESGTGQPAWNQTPGGTTADNGWNWTNWGPIVLWSANKQFNNASVGGNNTYPCIIWDNITGCCFINANPGSSPGTTGSTYPNFSSSPGSSVQDGTVKWFNLGSYRVPQTWIPSHSYPTLGSVTNNDSVCGIAEPASIVNGLPTSPVVYWQVNNTGSTQVSGSGGTAPPWVTGLGNGTGVITPDNQLGWLSLGSGTWVANFSYYAWTAQGTTFSVIVDSNNNFQVCTTSGVSGATQPSNWATGYNQTTTDGTVTWTCVGQIMNWAANTTWYLPTSGWFPPSTSVPFGGSLIVDSNGNLQAAVESGESGGSHPSWGTTPVGIQTTDNTITWQLVGAASSLGFSLTKGASFAYSYEARLADDEYNTTVPPNWPSALRPPTGSETGQISTASPEYTITGPIPTSVVTLTMPGSSNPAVDTIVIWETYDGGSTLFFVTEVPNTTPIKGIVQYQTVQITTGQSTIDDLIAAPIDDANNPPPAGFLPMAYHFERIWGAVGNYVYASGGPDVVVGNPNESFDPLDYFEFPAPVTNIVPTATGILVFLTSDVYAILGGPKFTTFFPTPMVPGLGLLNYNALDVHGGVIYMFTADAQLIAFDPSSGAQRTGGPIQDQLALYDPSTTYVTVHESGNDNAVFVSNGTTGWFRLNPYQFPNGNAVWSPFATITGGAGAVQSIEVSPGVKKLLIGGTEPNDYILQRDFSTYQDNGTSYTCYFTMGSINLANPGQIAGLTFCDLRATRVGTTPTCAFLLNEISGTFTPFPTVAAQAYPWQVYGATLQPASLYSNAYYFRSTGIPALCEHLQIQVSFPAENYANEVLSLTLFGTIEQSPEV